MTKKRLYVLVVDDRPDSADSMVTLLSCWDYDAAARYCGYSALAAVRARRPAVVILDIGMAPMDGFTFTVFLRGLLWCESTPVVAVSGHATELCRARARRLGIDHFLPKPANPELLRSLLSELVAPSGRPPAPEDRFSPGRRVTTRSAISLEGGRRPPAVAFTGSFGADGMSGTLQPRWPASRAGYGDANVLAGAAGS